MSINTYTPERREVNRMKKPEKSILRKRGQFTLPKTIVEELNLQEGDSFNVRLEDDGTITLVPLIGVPVDQAWFWSKEWQAEEREVEEQLKNHQYTEAFNVDDALGHLDALDSKD